MIFENGKYKIELSDVEEASCDSTHYDELYIDQSEYTPTSLINIKISADELTLKSILIGATGGGTCVHNTSVIADNERIVTCCGDTIFCFSIPELCLLWKTKADDATCFEIFKYQDDYLVHGEMEISRLRNDGHILWQRGGADIFTTREGKDDFIVTDNYIMATDWGYRRYKFNFDGNPL